MLKYAGRLEIKPPAFLDVDIQHLSGVLLLNKFSDGITQKSERPALAVVTEMASVVQCGG